MLITVSNVGSSMARGGKIGVITIPPPAPPPPLLATGGLALSPQATRAHVRTKYRLINCALEC